MGERDGKGASGSGRASCFRGFGLCREGRWTLATYPAFILFTSRRDRPADSAGLRAGDIIYMMDGTLIVSREDLARVMNRVRLGDTIWLSILKVNDRGH